VGKSERAGLSVGVMMNKSMFLEAKSRCEREYRSEQWRLILGTLALGLLVSFVAELLRRNHYIRDLCRILILSMLFALITRIILIRGRIQKKLGLVCENCRRPFRFKLRAVLEHGKCPNCGNGIWTDG